MTTNNRIFLLSPANCAGRRAGYLMNPNGSSPLAAQLREEGAPLGELFAFMSGLYFRGKLAYALRFAVPPPGVAGVQVITANRGLLPAETPFTLDDLRETAQAVVDHRDENYRQALLNSGLRLAAKIGDTCEVVLLGSIATPKYVEVLQECFAGRLLFPAEFVGRGDMSRGGLMLRCAADGTELAYIPVAGATRRGKRPAKLGAREIG